MTSVISVTIEALVSIDDSTKKLVEAFVNTNNWPLNDMGIVKSSGDTGRTSNDKPAGPAITDGTSEIIELGCTTISRGTKAFCSKSGFLNELLINSKEFEVDLMLRYRKDVVFFSVSKSFDEPDSMNLAAR